LTVLPCVGVPERIVVVPHGVAADHEGSGAAVEGSQQDERVIRSAERRRIHLRHLRKLRIVSGAAYVLGICVNRQ
jgi:hypothetical protein